MSAGQAQRMTKEEYQVSEGRDDDAVKMRANNDDSTVSFEAAAAAGAGAGAVASVERRVRNRMNNTEVARKAVVRAISEVERHRINERAAEMLKMKNFMKAGFEATVKGLTSAIRNTHEEISKGLSDRFGKLKDAMRVINANMAAADENQRNNFKILQHRILNTERQIGELRLEIQRLLIDLDTLDEERFNARKLELERLNLQMQGLADGLGAEIKGFELNLGNQLNNLLDKLRDFDRAMMKGLELSRLKLKNEREKLARLMLGERDPDKLKKLKNELDKLNKDAEEVYIYTCLACGSVNHGPGCLGFKEKDWRKPYTITRGQLQAMIDNGVSVRPHAGLGPDAYAIVVGGEGAQAIANLKQIMRDAQIELPD